MLRPLMWFIAWIPVILFSLQTGYMPALQILFQNNANTPGYGC